MDDEEVAVDGDEQDREGGEEDARGLDDPRQLAQDFLIMVVVVMMRVVTMMVVMMIKMVIKMVIKTVIKTVIKMVSAQDFEWTRHLGWRRNQTGASSLRISGT